MQALARRGLSVPKGTKMSTGAGGTTSQHLSHPTSLRSTRLRQIQLCHGPQGTRLRCFWTRDAVRHTSHRQQIRSRGYRLCSSRLGGSVGLKALGVAIIEGSVVDRRRVDHAQSKTLTSCGMRGTRMMHPSRNFWSLCLSRAFPTPPWSALAALVAGSPKREGLLWRRSRCTT